MKVRIWLDETSYPIEYDGVVNAYTKGPFYCVLREDDSGCLGDTSTSLRKVVEYLERKEGGAP